MASDLNRFKSQKEQSELTPIVEAYKEYKACKQNIEEKVWTSEWRVWRRYARTCKRGVEWVRESAREELEYMSLRSCCFQKTLTYRQERSSWDPCWCRWRWSSTFAAEIYRMYLHYAESKRWKWNCRGEEIGIGGMKNVTFMIDDRAHILWWNTNPSTPRVAKWRQKVADVSTHQQSQ